MGYVHSDIRELNIIFSSNGNDTWLLDFDLADCQGPYGLESPEECLAKFQGGIPIALETNCGDVS